MYLKTTVTVTVSVYTRRFPLLRENSASSRLQHSYYLYRTFERSWRLLKKSTPCRVSDEINEPLNSTINRTLCNDRKQSAVLIFYRRDVNLQYIRAPPRLISHHRALFCYLATRRYSDLYEFFAYFR